MFLLIADMNEKHNQTRTVTTDHTVEHHENTDLNRDPITGEPGAHPVGVGVGTAGGATAGAAIGAVGGPVGAAIGAVVGGVAGAYGGKAVAEKIDPTAEEAYWRENHAHTEFGRTGSTYDDYSPAYRTGYEGYNRHRDQYETYETAEPALQRDYEDSTKSDAKVEWEKAKHAVRSSWERAEAVAKEKIHDVKHDHSESHHSRRAL